MRKASAAMGTLLVLAMYWTLRAMVFGEPLQISHVVQGCSRWSAVFASWMVLFDNMTTLDSRMILTDIYLWAFHVATIAACFMSLRPNLSNFQMVSR